MPSWDRISPPDVGRRYLAVKAGVTGTVSAFDDTALDNATQQSPVQAVIDWSGPLDFRAQNAVSSASGMGRRVHDLPDSPESRFLRIQPSDANEDLLRRTNPLT